MPRKYLQILLNVLAGLAFLTFAVVLSPGPLTIENHHTIREIITNLLIFIFFYINFYYFLPKYYFPKRKFQYISILILSFLLIVIIPRVIFFSERNSIENHGEHFEHSEDGEHDDDRMKNQSQFENHSNSQNDSIPGSSVMGNHHDDFDNDGDIDREQDEMEAHRRHEMRENHITFLGFNLRHLLFESIGNFVLFLFVILFSLVIKTRSQLRRTEKEKLNAELSYLKAQINPHFLFNTLNSIYSLAIQKSDYTPTAVVKLSGMMRYVLTESAAEFVSLEKEINYVRDFVDLQKIRLGNTVDVKLEIAGDFIGNRIAPLILIAFIENAFKHGVSPEENSSIIINLNVKNKDLNLFVQNNKVNSKFAEDLSNRVGLENTISRLDLIYASSYKLNFEDTESIYSVELKLHLI